jgi:RHS repeat-associated protein
VSSALPGGLELTNTYNIRHQPLEFKASSTGGSAIDISYGFIDPVTTYNAGHVYSITNNLDSTRSQNFSYDSLNRISGALTASTYATSPSHCWGEAYTLDAWGNLNSIAATNNSNYTGCTQESGFSTTADGNNHLPNFSYDPSGNTQSDGVVTNYLWNAESQLKSAAGVSYLYDGDGKRVAKLNSSGQATKLYWYGSGDDILAETDGSGNALNEYVFFGGKRVALLPAGGTAQYYVEDMLGTSRIVTSNTGVVCYDADFYPYGGERAYTDTCTQNNYKFEGKERDTETGNDDFGARYYSNRFGRWLSADWSSVPAPVPYANLTNPQTLNLYAMVADDPESFAELDGHNCGPCTNDMGEDPEQNESQLSQSSHGPPTPSPPPQQPPPPQNTITTSFVTSVKAQGNGDLTTTITTTSVNVTVSTAKGHEGDFVSATTSTKTELYDAVTQKTTETGHTDPQSLNRDQTLKAIGAERMSQASEAALPSMAGEFFRITGRDMRKDPVKYIGTAAAVTSKACPHPACKAVAGAIAAGAGAYEAWKHATDNPSQ